MVTINIRDDWGKTTQYPFIILHSVLPNFRHCTLQRLKLKISYIINWTNRQWELRKSMCLMSWYYLTVVIVLCYGSKVQSTQSRVNQLNTHRPKKKTCTPQTNKQGARTHTRTSSSNLAVLISGGIYMILMNYLLLLKL